MPERRIQSNFKQFPNFHCFALEELYVVGRCRRSHCLGQGRCVTAARMRGFAAEESHHNPFTREDRKCNRRHFSAWPPCWRHSSHQIRLGHNTTPGSPTWRLTSLAPLRGPILERRSGWALTAIVTG